MSVGVEGEVGSAGFGRLPKVDHAAQDLEDVGGAMDLIQNDQLVFVAGKVKLRIGQPRAARGQLLVEIEGTIALLLSKPRGQGGFAHLSRSEQGHGGKRLQRLPEPVCGESRNHLAIVPPQGILARSILRLGIIAPPSILRFRRP